MSKVDTDAATDTSNSTAPQVDIIFVDNRGKNNDTENPIMEAVALTGEVMSEQSSMLSNLAYSNVISSNDLSTKNLVSNQDAQNKLRLLILSKAVNQIQNNQPLQARSAMDMLTNNELAQTVTDLKAIVTTFADKKTES
ncbi:hypothetical protein [Nitrosomonas sp.]|uniref:hypothetical protein n=1 Tax=Nitrosomonas sp. TaxID=42353 RepID=UPI0025E0A5F2|nr:hypothetical protein [Nitrosomonas sp.]MBV6447889.1 hypothetical protein [Nitrosomonas sp.]HNB02227.1 hypothetical protein [Nitrosomonas sp.]